MQVKKMLQLPFPSKITIHFELVKYSQKAVEMECTICMTNQTSVNEVFLDIQYM